MAKANEKVATRVVRDGGASGAGILYLVGTPIGNMEDITLRALRVLKEVDLIACEDTRHTMQLLDHYGIEKTMVSYHEHNELTRAAELIVHLEQGDNIAMVSDAGMPGVSDPGYRLIALAVRHHIKVVPVAGSVSVFVGAGGQWACHRFISLQRVSAVEAGRTPDTAGGGSRVAAHADFLRCSAPHR